MVTRLLAISHDHEGVGDIIKVQTENIENFIRSCWASPQQSRSQKVTIKTRLVNLRERRSYIVILSSFSAAVQHNNNKNKRKKEKKMKQTCLPIWIIKPFPWFQKFLLFLQNISFRLFHAFGYPYRKRPQAFQIGPSPYPLRAWTTLLAAFPQG